MNTGDSSSARIFRRPMRYRAVTTLVVLWLVGVVVGSPVPSGAAEGEKALRRANGQADVLKGDLYALVVGISKYANPGVPPLKISDKDAQDFAEFLRTQKDLFRDCKVTLLVNERATKIEVEKHLFYGLRHAGKSDTVILFFSGHGAVDPYQAGDFFFLTYDSDPNYLAPTAVHMSGLGFLKRIDCPRVLLIADACNAGGFSARGTKLAVQPFSTFIRQFTSSSGKVILTSSRPDEYSLEKPGMSNSVFTHYLLDGLRGSADSDGDGLVTVAEAYRYVYEKTKAESGGVQHPQFEGTVEGLFAIAHTAMPAHLPAVQQEVAHPVEPSDAASRVDRRLIAAIRAGNLTDVQRFVRERAILNVTDDLGWTALMHAVAKNNVKAGELLLAAGADPNVQDRLGWSALMLAAANGHAEIAEMLLKHGADKNARNLYGETAEMKASLGKHARVIRVLSKAASSPAGVGEKPAAAQTESPSSRVEKPKSDRPAEAPRKKDLSDDDSNRYSVDLPPIEDAYGRKPRILRGPGGGGITIGIGPFRIGVSPRRGSEETSDSE